MPEPTADATDAIRSYVIDHLTLILDNDNDLYNAVTAAAEQAITQDMGAPAPGPEEYARDYAGRSGGMFPREEYARAVGSRVADVVLARVEAELPSQTSPVHLFAKAMLDIGDRAMWDRIGDYYLPAPDPAY